MPSTTADRLRALLRWARGSTRRVAALLGVSQWTVQRWVTRKAGVAGALAPAMSRRSRTSCGHGGSPESVRAGELRQEHGVVVHARAQVRFPCWCRYFG
ncbi:MULTISPECIES: helix-turn-helix domain-containing protein [unclassified Streptomyces]|uniref:helix-turn-helix domain-containing protein n=1 Tax=unclassified Streptomyces TaxID=2593676 RepID=UPI003872AF26